MPPLSFRAHPILPRLALAALCVFAVLRSLSHELTLVAAPTRGFPEALDARFASVLALLPERTLVTFDSRGFAPAADDPQEVQRMTDAWLAARFALAPHHATLLPGADHVVAFYPDPAMVPTEPPGPEHRRVFDDERGLVLWSKP